MAGCLQQSDENNRGVSQSRKGIKLHQAVYTVTSAAAAERTPTPCLAFFLGKHRQNFLHLCLSFLAEQCVRVAAAVGTVLLASRRRGRVIVPLCGWEMRAQGCRALLGGSELKSLGALA